ncbi:LysR family transcriptional regulator [Hyphomicrobium sp. CS1GBMeth3]|uniref:LysR family transcriptional regulator n=1 Tax=Hyphomicrobium sp. CS1GBMeth3 TaxID=1892845 RepID=UPI001FCCDFC9|nr:LysR family transcriptional regulator [Hyphomicrobium sp. CS1GBMeth3]
MHQVRYFLAVARLLNFTRAAEECHVAQPSLTRAIKQLEAELGGDLFRRERNLTHLTDLGQRMLPMLQQCYDSALTAKTLAQSIKAGAVAPLAIGLSLAVDITLVITFVTELVRSLPGLELRFMRGTGPEVAEFLKKGEVEVALAGSVGETWDRLESWALFTEPYKFVVGLEHPLANKGAISSEDVTKARLVGRTHCEHLAEVSAFVTNLGMRPDTHQVCNDADVAALLQNNIGVSIMPQSSAGRLWMRSLDLEGFNITRTVSVYAVSGRQRSLAASTFIKMLRAADWSSIEPHSQAGVPKVA